MSVDRTFSRTSARAAAYRSWAMTEDPSARTAPARAAFLHRFERLVDPDGRLSEPERRRRAEAAKKAHFLALAQRSAESRRARRQSPGTGS